jgi:hypothetical protein
MRAVKNRRTSWTIAALVGTAALLAAVLAGPAFATNAQYYAASASSGSVPAGSAVTLTIRNCATNASPCTVASNAALGSARLTLPAGLLPQATVAAPAGKTWTGTVSGGVIELKAVDDASRLSAGESVSVTVTPTTAGSYTNIQTSAYYYTTLTSGPGSFSFQLKGTAPTVVVTPGPLTLAFSPFTPNPGIAKVSTPLSSNPATSALVTVSAADAWGNRPADGTIVTIALAGSPNPGGGALTLDSTVTGGTLSGSASFPNLKIGKVATGYALRATIAAPTTQPYFDSGLFNVLNDLVVCTGSSCANAATNDNGQASATSLTSAAPLSGELLTTQFLSDPLVAPPGACPGFTPIGQGTEVAITGGNPTSSRPSFTITFTIPKNLTVPGRPVWKYNVCLGATSFVTTAPWRTKSWNFSTWPWGRADAINDGTGRFWGLVPSCLFATGTDEDFFNWIQVPATNPCILSKKKVASGDVQIVLREPYPWDPRGNTG